MDKNTRILMLYQKLLNGEAVNKETFAMEYSINARSVDRDIQDIRVFLSESFSTNSLIYDPIQRGYRFEQLPPREWMGAEVLVLLQLLISSALLRDDELSHIIDAGYQMLPQYEQRKIKGLLQQSIADYQGPKHNSALMKMIGDLILAIYERHKIKLSYQAADEPVVVYPISLEFHGGSCYLIAIYDAETGNGVSLFQVDKIFSFLRTNKEYKISSEEAENILIMREAVRKNRNTKKFLY